MPPLKRNLRILLLNFLLLSTSNFNFRFPLSVKGIYFCKLWIYRSIQDVAWPAYEFQETKSNSRGGSYFTKCSNCFSIFEDRKKTEVLYRVEVIPRRPSPRQGEFLSQSPSVRNVDFDMKSSVIKNLTCRWLGGKISLKHGESNFLVNSGWKTPKNRRPESQWFWMNISPRLQSMEGLFVPESVTISKSHQSR